MLIVMYLNAWLFFAVVIGATLGYYIFGWRKIKMLQQKCRKANNDHPLDDLEKY